MKDLFHQDVVEMIERETRKYGIWSIADPDHPDFDEAYDLLWTAFGASGEMERKDILAGFLRAGAAQLPTPMLLAMLPSVSTSPEDCADALPNAQSVCSASRPSTRAQAAAAPNTPQVEVMCQPR